MDYHILVHDLPSLSLLDSIASLWNNNGTGRHAFYCWTGALLRRLLTENDCSVGRLLTAHAANDELVGFVHVARVLEDGYPQAGVVEAILVDACHRGRGVGTLLLERGLNVIETFHPRPVFVDALGAWPFGYGFNVLLDGSERSGVFLSEPPVYRLFRRAGFEPVRKSMVMRAELSGAVARPLPQGAFFAMGKRSENTWLDRVFRGRELWDYEMGRQDYRVLSRAIFGFMEGESQHEGRPIFSLFGVNTPLDMQRKGYAGINLSHLMTYVRGLGGEILELHVYADNTPAVRLYTSLGFKPKAETVMMHLRP